MRERVTLLYSLIELLRRLMRMRRILSLVILILIPLEEKGKGNSLSTIPFRRKRLFTNLVLRQKALTGQQVDFSRSFVVPILDQLVSSF